MKVALIIDTWFPQIGGGQINAWEISRRLAKKNIKFEVITRNSEEDKLPKVKNIKVHKLGPKANADNTFSKIAFVVRSFIFALNRDYDIIHVHPFLPAFSAKILNIIKKRPIVITVHGTRLFEKHSQLTPSRILEKIILTKIHYTAQISVTKAFTKIKNVNKNIVVIPNGVDINKFSKIKAKKIPYFKILWVGRFDSVKQVDKLILTMKIVKQKIPGAKLHLIGYGYEKEKLKDLVKKEKLQKTVVFKGKKTGDDLTKEFKSSHVFVLPSASEGQPLVLLEALAANLPTIATNVGGVPELIKTGENGILLEKVTPRSIAESILHLKTKKLEKTGFLDSPNNFNWDKIASKTLFFYKDAIKSSNL